MIDDDDASGEPDNMNDADLAKDSQDPRTANGMANALNDASNAVKGGLKASKLNVDHPYGDGKHSETGADTMKRLGAESSYGGQQ